MEPAATTQDILAARVLAVAMLVYAALVGRFAWRAVKVRMADRWSAVSAVAVLAALAAILWWRGATLLPTPFSWWAIAAGLIALMATLTWTLGRYEDLVKRFKAEFGERLVVLLQDVVKEEQIREMERLRERFAWGLEERRKAPHLMMGAFLAVYAAAGHWALLLVADLATRLGTEASVAGHRLQAVAEGPWLLAGHYVNLVVLLLMLFVLLPTDLMRLRYPELGYPFKTIILSRLRDKERDLFGAHLYVAASLPLAALVLAIDPTHLDTAIPAMMAAVGITTFADASSALFGRRWGRSKWPHNPDKSFVGSSAGTLVAFALAVPLVGPWMALVAAGVFLFVDVIAPVPVAITDNILNPVLLAVVFFVMRGYLDPLMPWY